MEIRVLRIKARDRISVLGYTNLPVAAALPDV